MTEMQPGLRPIEAAERIGTMDVLRGFALLGILLMNIEAFSGPMMDAFTGLNPALTGADRIADAAIYILVQGKFYTLFSLLFGMGFAVMSQRADARGQPFGAVYLRRSAVLMGFGLIHALLIWSGDILLVYGLLSFLLLAFRRMPAKWLPWLAIVAYLVPSGLMGLLGLLGSAMQLDPTTATEWNREMAKMAAQMAQMNEAQQQAYGAGTWWDATLQRMRDTGFMLSNLPMMGPMVFAMFLFGVWFVKSGAIASPAQFPRLFAVLRWVALPMGLASMGLSFVLQPTMHFDTVNVTSAFAFFLSSLGSVLMAFGYMAWVVRFAAGGGGSGWLAPAGRMALTNYLMQSVICTLVFYAYGLGYFEQMPRAWQAVFAVAVFLLQVLWSRAWLSRFRFGPAEWLWRSLTYLRAQPMRR